MKLVLFFTCLTFVYGKSSIHSSRGNEIATTVRPRSSLTTRRTPTTSKPKTTVTTTTRRNEIGWRVTTTSTIGSNWGIKTATTPRPTRPMKTTSRPSSRWRATTTQPPRRTTQSSAWEAIGWKIPTTTPSSHFWWAPTTTRTPGWETWRTSTTTTASRRTEGWGQTTPPSNFPWPTTTKESFKSKIIKKVGPKLPSIAGKLAKVAGKWVWNKIRGGKTTTQRPVWQNSLSQQINRDPTPFQTEEITVPRGEGFDCPSKIDAYVSFEDISLLFQDSKVFAIENGSVNGILSSPLNITFPGLSSVSAAVYEAENETLLLFEGRKIHAFSFNDTTFTAKSDYPKELPDSIIFTPIGAFSWNDDVILVSKEGFFARYDISTNTPLSTGRMSSEFEGFPENVKSVSISNDTMFIYTHEMIYEYDELLKSLFHQKSVSSFQNC